MLYPFAKITSLYIHFWTWFFTKSCTVEINSFVRGDISFIFLTTIPIVR